MNQPNVYSHAIVPDALIFHEGFAHGIPTYKITPEAPKSQKVQNGTRKEKNTSEDKKTSKIKH